MERYFPNASQFDPWRWLGKTDVIHPHSSLPFGHGARMCPGRRFAEQEILLGVAEVRSSFSKTKKIDLYLFVLFLLQMILRYELLAVNSKDISMILTMNLIPSEPVDFKLTVR